MFLYGGPIMYKKILIFLLCLSLVGCGTQPEVNTELGTDVVFDMPMITTISNASESGTSEVSTEVSEVSEEVLGVIPADTTVATVYIPEQVEETEKMEVTESVSTVTSVKDETGVTEQSDVVSVPTVANYPNLSTSEGVKQLTGALVHNCKEQNGVLISGYSAYSALMYIYPYTQGETKAEIASIVGSVDAAKFRSEQVANNIVGTVDATYFGDLLGVTSTDYALETSGLFLINEGTVLNTDNTDDFVFKNLASDDVVSYVNNFVADKTHNLISTMIDKPFDSLTKAVIFDVLYFKDSWQKPFEIKATDSQVFYGKDIETTVDMMYQTGSFGVYDNIIRLNYANTPIVMEIVKDITDKDSAYQYYCDNYNKIALTNNVRVAMPKFEIELTSDLKDGLQAAGITKLFEATNADLSLLADDLYISDMLQKTKISVDEEGTEAAAVTELDVKVTSLLPMEDEPFIDFKIDHPFLFVLRNTKTDDVLFVGYFYNMKG